METVTFEPETSAAKENRLLGVGVAARGGEGAPVESCAYPIAVTVREAMIVRGRGTNLWNPAICFRSTSLVPKRRATLCARQLQDYMTLCSIQVHPCTATRRPGTVGDRAQLTATAGRCGELPSWSAAFIGCCLVAGDEPQVKVERPQRSEDVRMWGAVSACHDGAARKAKVWPNQTGQAQTKPS